MRAHFAHQPPPNALINAPTIPISVPTARTGPLVIRTRAGALVVTRCVDHRRAANPPFSREEIEAMRRERNALALRIAESQETIEQLQGFAQASRPGAGRLRRL